MARKATEEELRLIDDSPWVDNAIHVK
ncbi:uncharacterized protein G2W53_031991 [Senna tora]|uniref:Uncharacterized protein n=1 Tax=Senna tora TaxID=362788 RepID=A0A834SVE3_9FABA|nr:uncharacterized protein G2W53_031991 [Senna tora]